MVSGKDESKQEVVVTPEMLEAGEALVQAWDYGSPSLTARTHRELALQVYEAMRRLSPDQ